MATDYEEFYRENRHGLGGPSKAFVDFFDSYTLKNARVLDVGCGQGRDSLFIARKGHQVKAVDQSPSGIADLKEDAQAEGLNIETVVADIRTHTWGHPFDVIIVDRTLHMLNRDDRIQTLDDLLNVTKAGSYVLIADERSNISDFKTGFERSEFEWSCTLQGDGILFMFRQ